MEEEEDSVDDVNHDLKRSKCAHWHVFFLFGAIVWIYTHSSEIETLSSPDSHQEQPPPVQVSCESSHLEKGINFSDESRLVISTLVFEDREYVDMYFDNILSYTRNSTRVIAHLSAAANYSEEEVKHFISYSPRRYYTHEWQGSLAHAHLRNVQWLSTNIGLQFAHLMLLASNSWLVRFGVEDYIRNHNVSTRRCSNPVSAEEEDIEDYGRFCYRVDEDSFDHSFQETEEWDAEEEEYSRIWHWNTMHTIIAPPLSDGTEVPWFHQKHEGTFYPSRIIIDLVRDLEAAPQHWDSFLSTNAYLEEIIFSTWAMRRLNAEHRNADGFGIVAFTGGTSRDPTTKFATPNKILEVLHAYEDVFGIKPVNRHLDEEGAKRYIQGELHQNATKAQAKMSRNDQNYGELPNLVFNGKVVQ